MNIDDYSLKLFPNAKVYPDGVDVDFDLMRVKTLNLFINKFCDGESKVGKIYFNFDTVEFWAVLDPNFNVNACIEKTYSELF